jgi:hypothetical protein
MSGAGGSQSASSAVRRSQRQNTVVDYRSSEELIEESDEDEDLGGYSSSTEGPSDMVFTSRTNADDNDNGNLEEPSLGNENEGDDVGENTGSSAIADPNVEWTATWEEFSDSDLVGQPRKEYDGGPLRPANEASALKTGSKAIDYVDLFYPPSRMRQQFEHSKKYRDLDSNHSKYISHELNYAEDP